MYEYGMHRKMPRGYSKRTPKRLPQRPRRATDPKDFAQVFENPLASLMPMLDYLTGLRSEDGEEQEKESNRLERGRPHDERWMYDKQEMLEYEHRRSFDRDWEDEEAEEESVRQGHLWPTIRKQPVRTFLNCKDAILQDLDRNRERMNTNRHNTINFIENELSVTIKHNDLLNTEKLAKNWAKIEGIVKRKLAGIELNFEMKQPMLKKVRAFEGAVLSMLGENRKVKVLRELSREHQSSIFSLILLYLALPALEDLHQQVTSFERRAREIFQGFSSREEELRRVLRNLPYKESSFYWEKIIDCCRQVSDCDHYRQLETQKVEAFEAEYAGTVTQEVLRRCREGEWLDNSITSAVLEYLKQVEGANNYHSDSNFRNCLFTHSETDIFLNSPRDPDNYLQYDQLIFLVNIPNVHWFVIALYNRRCQIVVYDSLPTYADTANTYCEKIVVKLKRRKPQADYETLRFDSPRQNNVSDCGVFSLVNIIMAFDKDEHAHVGNSFNPAIIPEIRHSLFLFLLYLGYCKRAQVVPRKDYFDILFRSTIIYEMRSRLHEDKRRGR